jgi:hypothetical protein
MAPDINSNIAIIFEVQLSEVFTLLTDSSFFPVKINVKNMIISKIIFLSIKRFHLMSFLSGI